MTDLKDDPELLAWYQSIAGAPRPKYDVTFQRRHGSQRTNSPREDPSL